MMGQADGRALKGITLLSLLAILAAGSSAAITSSLPEDPTLPRAVLQGVRTGIAYEPAGHWPAAECRDCARPVPANEWLWIEIRGVESEWGFVDVRVTYMEGLREARLMRFLQPLPPPDRASPTLLPAARSTETEIIVRVEVPGPNSEGKDFINVFPVGTATMKDPRELRLAPLGRWETYEIEASGTDRRFAAAFGTGDVLSPPEAPGVILDYVATRADGSFGGAFAGYHLGSDDPSPRLAIGAAPPAIELSIIPTQNAGLGTGAYWGSWEKGPHSVDLTYGSAGTDAREEILLFSLNGSWLVKPVTSGPLSVTRSTREGIRIDAGAAHAQALATVEARATFANASFVIAEASVGTEGFGSGTAIIRHRDNEASGPIDNAFTSRLRVLSHGDCSGEWSARLEGTAVTTLSKFDAAILSADGWTPSSWFQALWETDNGWCN